MNCLTNLCYVCLETKNNLISSVDSSLSVNKDLLDILGFCADNLAWLKTKRIILICEECCSRLRETYQFLKMWHENSAILQGYMDQLNTENEAEPSIQLKDINQIKCEIKIEEIYTDECEPRIKETPDVFVNIEDPLVIEEETWKKEETDDREEYPMDNNSPESMNNESNTEIFVNSNTDITDTDRVGSGFTCKQAPATNKKDSYTPTNKPYTCSTCSESFISKPDLKSHTQIHTGEKPYKCAICDKCFIRLNGLKNHMRKHIRANNSTKTMNNESTTEISVNSNTHITDTDRVSSGFTCKQVRATNEKDSNTPSNNPYTCSTCSKSFVSKADLKRHTQIHTGERPYKCAICDKCFIRLHCLKCHMRTHTGEKPYRCDTCDACFVQKSHLLYHMRKHTGEKRRTIRKN